MYDLVVFGNPAYCIDPFASNGPNERLDSGALYAAITGARLNLNHVAIIGNASTDRRPFFQESLEQYDLELFFSESQDTTGFQIGMGENEERELKVLGLADDIRIRNIPEDYLQSEVILLAPVLREIHNELVEWLSGSTDAKIFLDPRFRLVTDEGRVRLLGNHAVAEGALEFVDYIKPNKNESFIMTGENDPYLAAEMLVESGAPVAIVTLGIEGSIVYDGEDYIIIPAFQTEVVDTLGAGDVYMAGFISEMIRGKSLEGCGAFGSALASMKIESSDGISFKLYEKEVRRRQAEVLEESVHR
ncbi:MAG: carbohydrate kinase family protein [Candidatus Hodarchaeota archaeon]